MQFPIQALPGALNQMNWIYSSYFGLLLGHGSIYS